MSLSPFGKMRLCIYGGSHEERLGLTMLPPAGLRLDTELISRDIDRRRGGRRGGTKRAEADLPIYLSGIENGVTNGETLRVEFENSAARPSDYERISALPRPSHCDYPAYVKYGSIPCGGGMFSGRMTLPLVFAGAVARQLLLSRGVTVGGHWRSVGNVHDRELDPLAADENTLLALRNSGLPVLDKAKGEEMLRAVESAAAMGDSLGGSVELCAVGLPAGTGGPLWSGLESVISALLYAVPGVKAVGFGAGQGLSALRGSEANDPLCMKGGRVELLSNRSGGINGGMANGAPLLVTAFFRPTPSIALPQRTVNLETGEDAEIIIAGRHDGCIALRGLFAAEAALCLALTEFTEENTCSQL